MTIQYRLSIKQLQSKHCDSGKQTDVYKRAEDSQETGIPRKS